MTIRRADPGLARARVEATKRNRQVLRSQQRRDHQRAGASVHPGGHHRAVKDGLYSSHLITWRQQRERGLTPKKRGRKPVSVDPQWSDSSRRIGASPRGCRRRKLSSISKNSCCTPADSTETHAQRRGRLMTAVELVATSIRAAPACRVLGVARASMYRGRRPVVVGRPRPVSPRALDKVEQQTVLGSVAHAVCRSGPAQMHAALLDEGTHLCSPARCIAGSKPPTKSKNRAIRCGVLTTPRPSCWPPAQ